MTRTPTGRTDRVEVAGAHERLVTPAEERLVTPADRTARGHAAATPFPVARTVARTGPFRPLVRGIDNAVLARCGTTPGVGVPAVLISGKPPAARITGAPARTGAARGGQR
ncbi:hypothetical protein STENM223S_01363 [Streptomyces tendae]